MTLDVPAVVGFPLTVPVVALMVRPFGSPVWLQASGLPAVELPTIGRLTVSPTLLVWLPGLVILIESLTAPVCHAPTGGVAPQVLHGEGAGGSVWLNAPPGLPAGIPAHLSPISPPVAVSNQAVPNGSVIVPAYRAPPMMLKPSLFPAGAGLTKSSPQLVPASGTYGRLMNGCVGRTVVAAFVAVGAAGAAGARESLRAGARLGGHDDLRRR